VQIGETTFKVHILFRIFNSYELNIDIGLEFTFKVYIIIIDYIHDKFQLNLIIKLVSLNDE